MTEDKQAPPTIEEAADLDAATLELWEWLGDSPGHGPREAIRDEVKRIIAAAFPGKFAET